MRIKKLELVNVYWQGSIWYVFKEIQANGKGALP